MRKTHWREHWLEIALTLIGGGIGFAGVLYVLGIIG